ncbi:hypothetical protein [Pseudobutyrivibrio xylanivorans]|uniref:Uncharacterized protein n=1 Tax=Pseudobutyrivibrio xylanivorans DSM 14809 TaxID=1123012 RepID=A0A1M6FQK6_PSEXY|nr:hypothetical protein [Pseudobutyrivibrio xylanivorans]SHI99981.1 hypothetical protein SAMN02745725_01528 [Pseudobutyrivibrio xylanivorans DSM 14809]
MKKTKLFIPIIIISVLIAGCSSQKETYNIEDTTASIEQESGVDSTVEQNIDERQSSSDLKELSIKTELIDNNYNKTGPAPRDSYADLLLEYYKLSGDVSSDFLKERDEFFEEISMFQLEKKQSFEDFLQSDYYDDLDSAIGWNNEMHHTKEYIERNDMIIFSSLVVSNGSYGGSGYCDFYAFNYDIQNKIELTLNDVVDDYDSLRSIVIEKVITDPPSIFYSDNPDYIGSFIDNAFYSKDVPISDKVAWTMDENGLTIYYSKSQIGDVYRCTIPYSDNCITPSFRLVKGVDYNSEYLK